MKLKLTQQIIIGQKHENYASLDRLCWLSKNLYNQALYQIRQQYSKDKTYLVILSYIDYYMIQINQTILLYHTPNVASKYYV